MNSQKQNRHSLMAKGIMVLLALLVLVFIFTMAWFISQDHPAIANGLMLNTNSSIDFDVAIGFTAPFTVSDNHPNYVMTEFTDSASSVIDFENLYLPNTVSFGTSNGEPVTHQNEVFSASEADEHKYNLLNDFKPLDLTGDGIELYRPTMTAKNRSIDLESRKMSSDISENREYISFDLYIRSETPGMKVILDKDSYVISAIEAGGDVSLETLRDNMINHPERVNADANHINNSNLISSTLTPISNRLSEYGAFSEDSVVGAVRIAFSQYTNTDSLDEFFGPASGTYSPSDQKRLLWIPRSDVYLQDDNTSDTNWVMHTDKDSNWKSSAVNFHYNGTNYEDIMGTVLNNNRTVTYETAASEHWYYSKSQLQTYPNVADASKRFVKINDTVSDIKNTSADTTVVQLTNLSTVQNGKTYYYGKCRVNLWIEGCDAEARRAIDGGSFFFGFDLSGQKTGN